MLMPSSSSVTIGNCACCARGSAASSATSAARLPTRPNWRAAFERPLAYAEQIRSQQQRQRGWKLYSFHAPEVECIGKGKASAPYEFGVKASIVTTNACAPGGQFVLHAKALPGNPYDGHTLAVVIDTTEKLTGCAIERAYVFMLAGVLAGPSLSAIARFTVATSSFKDVSGSWTAVTRSRPLSRSGITFDHNGPSAHAPCTRITFEALVILILPFLPQTIETARRRGVPSERPRGGNPAPIDQGDGIRCGFAPSAAPIAERVKFFDREGQCDVWNRRTRNWHYPGAQAACILGD
jgi:hypothetical protein